MKPGQPPLLPSSAGSGILGTDKTAKVTETITPVTTA